MIGKKTRKYISSVLLSLVIVFGTSQSIFVQASTDVTTKPVDTQAPTVPGGFKVKEVTATTIGFNWIPSTDNVGVTEYDLYSGTNFIGSSKAVNQENIIYVLKGLASNTTYTFTVKAKDAAGNLSKASDKVTVTTAALKAPINLKTTTLSDTNLTLSWTGAVENGGVTSYNIYKGSTLIATTTGATSYKITGLIQNTNYVFTVKAKDIAGKESPASIPLSVKTNATDVQAPTAPSNLKSTAKTDTSVSLSWTASTDNVKVTGYKIYNGKTLVTTTSSTSYNVTKLTANTAYKFTVTAIDAAGNVSPASNELAVTTNGVDSQAPTAPINLKSTAKTDTTVTLVWTASTDNVKVTGYNIYNGDILVGTTSSTSYTVTKLTANTTYKFNVKAKDAAGNISVASNELAVTTNGADTQAPTAPINLKSTAKTDTSVSLSWTASTDNVKVTGYDIYNGSTLVGTTSSTSYNVTKLTANTAYKFTVKAKDAAGNVSAASNELAVTTNAPTPPDTQAPSAPTNVVSTAQTDTTISLAWTASTDNVKVVGYRVYCGKTLVGKPTSTSYTVTGLSAQTSYTFTVTAVDAAGNESAAGFVSTDKLAPTAPSNLRSTAKADTTVTLAWATSTDNVKVTEYNIYSGTKLVGTTNTTSFKVTGLTANTAYKFTVKAKDAAGNESIASNELSVATSAPIATSTVK